MLSNIRFIPPNLNEKFKGMLIPWTISQMFNMSAAWVQVAFVRELSKMHQLQCRFGHGRKSLDVAQKGKCDQQCLSANVLELANGWAHCNWTWRLHSSTGRGSTSLKALCVGLSQWESTREMDQACWWWRQCAMEMATMFTWPDTLWFFNWG